MAIEHILTDADTPQSLALKYGVDWKTIVDYNSLEYPYFLDSKEAYEKLYASGYLTVTRELYQSDLIFYKGSQFATKIDAQGIRKIYEVVEDTTIPAGQATGYVFVRCVNFGTFGNTIAHSITQPYKLHTSVGQYISTLTITNELPFDNGTDATVKFTGQAIYIPSEGDDTDVQLISNVDTYLNMLGGEDFELAEDGDMTEDDFGDIGTKIGLENIKQAIKHRLMSERGSLPHHPEYGTRLHELIGKAQMPYINKLMELDIEEALSYEDRISSYTVNAVEVQGTSILVDLTLEINKVGENFRLQLDF